MITHIVTYMITYISIAREVSAHAPVLACIGMYT